MADQGRQQGGVPTLSEAALASRKANHAKRKKSEHDRDTSRWWQQFVSDYYFLAAPLLALASVLAVAMVKVTDYFHMYPLGDSQYVDAAVYQSSLVASVGVCGPIFLELMQDFSFVVVSTLTKRAVYVGKMRYFIGRATLLTAVLVPSCFLLLQIQLNSSYQNRAALFVCTVYIRRIMFFFSVLFCMAPIGDPTFTPLRTFVVMLLYVAAQLCEFYNINQGATQSNTVMEGFSIAFLILFYASCMVLVVMWAVRKRKRLWALYAGDVAATPQQAKKGATASSVKTAKSAIKAIPEEFYELGILVLSLLGCIAGHIVDGQHSWNGSTEWGVVSSEIKAGYTYLAFIFTAFMSALLGRHARIAVIIEKDNTLEAKKAFVRYISHEIRTPLNTVCLGLDVLSDDLRQSLNPVDVERVDTIGDISASCQVALSILNDLLNMDKLESGTLLLEKRLEPVLPFLAESVAAFKLQAEKQRIDMGFDLRGTMTGDEAEMDKYIASLGAVSPMLAHQPLGPSGAGVERFRSDSGLNIGYSMGLCPQLEDCVNIDPHKFGQVVRNLLSNALKFTRQEGGTVTVRVRAVDSFSLYELVDTDEFKLFGKTSFWDMLNQAVVVRRLLTSERSTEEGDTLAPMGTERMSNRSLFSRMQSRNPHVPSRGSSVMSIPRVPSSTHDHGHDRGNSGYSTGQSNPVSVPHTPRDTAAAAPEARRILVIEVVDTGVGMPPEVLPRIFNEVLQINPGELQQGGGSGLGLMLTKGIVEQHGGKISVYSAGLHTGCTFTVLLPLFEQSDTKVLEQIEDMNREERENVTRKVFINKFLEGKSADRERNPPAPARDADLDATPPDGVLVKAGGGGGGPPVAGGGPGRNRRGSAALNRFGAYVMRIAEADVESDRSSEVSSEATTHLLATGRRTSAALGMLAESDEKDGGAWGPPAPHGRLPPLRRFSEATAAAMATQRERMVTVTDLFILVIDDSALNRRMLIKLLENRGHRCDEARHGREGVEKVEQRLRLLDASTHEEEGSTRNVPHVVAGTNIAVPETAGGAVSAAPGPSGPSAGGGEAKGLDVVDLVDHREEMAGAHGNGARATLAPPSLHGTPRAHRAQAPSGPYDVILIDYVMPVLDGPSACAEMRKLGHTGMIIGVTGNVAPSDIEFFQSRGANTVLTKPLSMDAFNAAVRSHAQALMSGSALESRDEPATAGHNQGATATP